jgi:hypothetical protein
MKKLFLLILMFGLNSCIYRSISVSRVRVENNSGEKILITSNFFEDAKIVDIGNKALLPYGAQGEFLIIKQNQVLIFKPLWGDGTGGVVDYFYKNNVLYNNKKEKIKPRETVEFTGYVEKRSSTSR